MCGLEEFADAIIGSLGVEQRKRTTIGVELAAKVGLVASFSSVVGLDMLRFSPNSCCSLMSQHLVLILRAHGLLYRSCVRLRIVVKLSFARKFSIPSLVVQNLNLFYFRIHQV